MTLVSIQIFIPKLLVDKEMTVDTKVIAEIHVQSSM